MIKTKNYLNLWVLVLKLNANMLQQPVQGLIHN